MLQSSLAVFERSDYVFPQLRPVLHDRRNIVRALLDCLARCILPVAHAFYGHDATLDFKGLAGFWDGGYLLERSSVLTCPSATPFEVVHAPAMWMGDLPFALSAKRRTVLPSIAAICVRGRATLIPARDEAFHIVLRRL